MRSDLVRRARGAPPPSARVDERAVDARRLSLALRRAYAARARVGQKAYARVRGVHDGGLRRRRRGGAGAGARPRSSSQRPVARSAAYAAARDKVGAVGS